MKTDKANAAESIKDLLLDILVEVPLILAFRAAAILFQLLALGQNSSITKK